MSVIGCIVGSGFSAQRFAARGGQLVDTPFGATSSPLWRTAIATTPGSTPVVFLARHGLEHQWAPHSINYRANVWALRESGVRWCIGINVVGGIAESLRPGALAVPHQVIDYTWGREGSFAASPGRVDHIEFTQPFSETVRAALLSGCARAGLPQLDGVCGVTQGPRLETAAEIDRLERDGCTMVGMTALPEAALAREAGIEYAILAGSVNHAAGRAPDARPLHAEMLATVDGVMTASETVLGVAVGLLAAEDL